MPLNERFHWISNFACALALLAALAGLVSARSRNGLRADYGIFSPRGHVSVGVGRDRLLWFPRVQLLLAPYLAAWNSERLGFPTDLPTFDISWTGILYVESNQTIHWAGEGSGNWSVEIGGAEVLSPTKSSALLAAQRTGPISVRVRLRTVGPKSFIKLSELDAEGHGRPLGANFYPDADARRLQQRDLLLALLAIILAIPFTGLRWRSWPDPRRLYPVAVVMLLSLSFFLRFQDRIAVPYLHETMDEYYVAWSGYGLLRGTSPTAWEWWQAYQLYPDARPLVWFGSKFVLVTPYFHEPPLFPLVTAAIGEFASAFGTRPIFPELPILGAPPLEILRVVPILFSTVALWLLLDIGRRLFGPATALAAGVIYATTPSVVALHRLVKDESLIAVLILVAVWLRISLPAPTDGSQATTSHVWRSRLGFALLAAVCPLVKITALFLPLALLGLLILDILGEQTTAVKRERWGEALAVLCGTILGILISLGYAAALDWNLYLKVFEVDAGRSAGLSSAWRLLDLSIPVQDLHFDPSWTLWLPVVALPMLAWRAPSIAWILATYVLTMTMAAGEHPLYGWYKIPLVPLLSLGAAAALLPIGNEVGEFTSAARISIWPGATLALLWLLCTGTSLSVLGISPGIRPTIAISALLLFLGMARTRIPPKLWSTAVWTLVGLTALLNIEIILNFRFYY